MPGTTQDPVQTPDGRETIPDGRVESEVKETPEAGSERAEGQASELEKVDLSKIPEEYRDEVKKLEKQFKAAYTKARQKDTEESRILREQLVQAQRALQEFQTVAEDVLKDPKKLDYYRNIYGPQYGIKVNQDEDAPVWNTEEDVRAWVKKQIEMKAAEVAEQKAAAIKEELMMKARADRWNSAIATLKGEDPMFRKYEKLICNLILSDPKYNRIYTQDNEAQVLRLATEDFKTMLKEDLDATKQTTLESLQAKTQGTTEIPTRPATGIPSRPLTKEEIIAKVRKEKGEWVVR